MCPQKGLMGGATGLLVGFRRVSKCAGFVPESLAVSPSSGYLALYTLLHLCSHVDMYGYGRDASSKAKTPYKYFSWGKQQMYKSHNMVLEKELFKALERTGTVTVCDGRDWRCGMQAGASRVKADPFCSNVRGKPAAGKTTAATATRRKNNARRPATG